ncbi:MAG: Rrf2 family transcriptional regulator [Hyphomicrobiaceae bacterium]|nr:Rrf2 family transcriptional regulator [Hyphomicrobiaceae bacterium]
MITQRTRYAFKALFQLAGAGGGSLAASEMAAVDNIPRAFLDQILLELRRGGLIVSKRGRIGGYSLARDPGDISLAEVMRLVDGPLAPLPCLSKTAYRRCAECTSEGSCELRRVFAAVYEKLLMALEGTTLADGHNTDALERLADIIGAEPAGAEQGAA